MKSKILLLFLVANLFFLKDQFAQPCKEVIAYYPNWQWYDRNKLVNPASIDYSQYSIINYAFFNPLSDGSIVETDSWADENLLFGQHDWVNGGYLPNTSLIDIAHNNNVKVLVSIGGWTLSNNFPGIAADSIKRTYFASECTRLLQLYNFDGIDLDWEYPGFAEHNGTPLDGANFTLLVQEVRDSIDALGLLTGKDYLLSSCFSADPQKMEIIEWTNLIPELDMFNMMTYDFFGAWSSLSNHNSPLYPPVVGNPVFNIDSTFYYVTQVHGVPSSMVNIGIPFYGRSVTGCTGLHQSNSGSPDGSTFWEDEGSPLYYNILNKMNQFSSYWDTTAQVPYLLGNAINTFVSYDNEQSVALKAEYILNKNARGVIIWELTGDYLETTPGSGIVSGTPLIDTINIVLCSVVTAVAGNQIKDTNQIFVYPNPAKRNEKIFIQIPNNNQDINNLEVFTSSGKCIKSVQLINQSSLQLSFQSKGIYLLRIKNIKLSVSEKIFIY